MAEVYFALDEYLKLDWLRGRILDLPRDDRWQSLARAALREDLHVVHSAITAEVLRTSPPGAQRSRAGDRLGRDDRSGDEPLPAPARRHHQQRPVRPRHAVGRAPRDPDPGAGQHPGDGLTLQTPRASPKVCAGHRRARWRCHILGDPAIASPSIGCGSFSEIVEGAPGLSRTLLSQRLKQLERLAIVESAPNPDGRGRHYELTPAGHALFKVCVSLGEWGAAWLEIAPEHLDPFVALWSMCNMLHRDRLPDRRVVIRFDFTGRQRPERYWLLIEQGDTEICKTYPGLDEDLYITAEAEAFVKWHTGQLSWAEATPQPPHPRLPRAGLR